AVAGIHLGFDRLDATPLVDERAVVAEVLAVPEEVGDRGARAGEAAVLAVNGLAAQITRRNVGRWGMPVEGFEVGPAHLRQLLEAEIWGILLRGDRIDAREHPDNQGGNAHAHTPPHLVTHGLPRFAVRSWSERKKCGPERIIRRKVSTGRAGNFT